MSERGGPVHSYTVRAHHHDGSGGSERAAPNRNTPLAWRVQGVAPNEGNGQGKDRGSGSGALNHARARAGTGSARTAQKNQKEALVPRSGARASSDGLGATFWRRGKRGCLVNPNFSRMHVYVDSRPKCRHLPCQRPALGRINT